jgi:hypothetical protein
MAASIKSALARGLHKSRRPLSSWREQQGLPQKHGCHEDHRAVGKKIS